MKQQYYYTINSLPHLSFEGPPPIDRGEFLARIESELTTSDMEILRSVRLYQMEPERGPIHVLEQWYDWERGLRNQLARLRAAKLGMDYKEFTQAGNENALSTRLANEIFQIDSPLDAENKLNKIRWDFLEELEVGHHFDVERLAVYFLKIQILERKSLFNKEKGRERLGSVTEQVDSIWRQEGRVGF